MSDPQQARHAAFLIVGKDKRLMLERLRRADDSLPAANVHPIGTLHIFCDADAASNEHTPASAR
jgi:6-phosphogluconolactonase/glucosamine-6-phosphate isomerase/deaminase